MDRSVIEIRAAVKSFGVIVPVYEQGRGPWDLAELNRPGGFPLTGTRLFGGVASPSRKQNCFHSL
jgi:hypothetical protein